MTMTRREFFVAGLAMAATGPASKYQIVDAQIHVWINDPLMPPLGKHAQALKIPMQVYAPITRMPDLVHLIEQCSDLTIVIDHMADCPVDHPQELEKLIALARYPRVFVKSSHTWSISRQPYPWLDAQEHVNRLHAVYGPQRLMWASDWPV